MSTFLFLWWALGEGESYKIVFDFLVRVKVRPHLHANSYEAEARRTYECGRVPKRGKFDARTSDALWLKRSSRQSGRILAWYFFFTKWTRLFYRYFFCRTFHSLFLRYTEINSVKEGNVSSFGFRLFDNFFFCECEAGPTVAVPRTRALWPIARTALYEHSHSVFGSRKAPGHLRARDINFSRRVVYGPWVLSVSSETLLAIRAIWTLTAAVYSRCFASSCNWADYRTHLI